MSANKSIILFFSILLFVGGCSPAVTGDYETPTQADGKQTGLPQSTIEVSESIPPTTTESRREIETNTAITPEPVFEDMPLPASAQENEYTPEPALTSQAAMQAMQEKVAEIYKSGLIGSSAGSYVHLKDFDENWAQRGWFQWWSSGYTPRNFILRGMASWDSDEADPRPESAYSGCGIVFRASEERAFYVVYIGLDGMAHLHVFNGETQASMAQERYGEAGLSGSADFMLVVEDDWFTFYIDGERILQSSAQTHQEGELALTLLSGTNKGYGTHCRMTDLDLWMLDEGDDDETLELPYQIDFEKENPDEWVVYGDEWQVMEEDGNHYWLASGEQGYPQAWLDPGTAVWQNYRFQSRMRFEQPGAIFLCVRAGSAGESFYSAYLDSKAGYVSLNDYDNTSEDGEDYQLLAENKFEFEPDSWYRISLEVQDEQLRLLIGDELILSAQQSSWSQGGVGFYMEPGNIIGLDDITVWPLTP